MQIITKCKILNYSNYQLLQIYNELVVVNFVPLHDGKIVIYYYGLTHN